MEKGKCHSCEKSHRSAKLVVCEKSDKLVCKDCCVKTNGNAFKKCNEWALCWMTTFI